MVPIITPAGFANISDINGSISTETFAVAKR